MRTALAMFLAASFLGIAVFGAFAMDHAPGHGHHGCIAAAAQGTDCPEEGGFSSLNFHLGAFKNFSAATLTDNFVGALFALAMLAALAAFAAAAYPALFFPAVNRRRRSSEYSHPPLQRKLAYWLALHENSPALA